MFYIACYGDSLVQGFPYGPKYSWTASAEKAGNINMLNYGLCGDCCDDILFLVRQYALPDYVRHILFLDGANDILQGRRQESILENYRRLLSWCAERKYALCVALPLVSADEYLNRRLIQLRQDVELLCKGKAFTLDLQPAIGLDAGARKRAYLDGVHPLAATYEAMGAYAAPLLASWLQGGTK